MTSKRPDFGKPLHLLHVCRSYPHHRAGGMEQHAQDLLEGLINAGHRVSVITTPLPNSPALKPLEPNGQLVQLTGKAARYSVFTFTELTKAVKRLHENDPVDVIHAQGFMGIPLSWPLVGLSTSTAKGFPPVVHSIHGTLFSETPLHPPIFNGLSFQEKVKALIKFKHRLGFWPVWELFLRSKPHLITDSYFSQSLVKRRGAKEAAVIPLGISTPSLPVLPPQNRILFVGRLETIKNADFAVRVLECLPEPFKLDLVGEGPERPRLERLIEATGLSQRVHLWGRLPACELDEKRQHALALLNPDGGFPAFGLVNAEALCQGLPVMTTPHGAHAEVVHSSEEGTLLSLTNPYDWAKAFLEYAETETLERRTERSTRNKERFMAEKMVNRLLLVYEQLLNP